MPRVRRTSLPSPLHPAHIGDLEQLEPRPLGPGPLERVCVGKCYDPFRDRSTFGPRAFGFDVPCLGLIVVLGRSMDFLVSFWMETLELPK